MMGSQGAADLVCSGIEVEGTAGDPLRYDVKSGLKRPILRPPVEGRLQEYQLSVDPTHIISMIQCDATLTALRVAPAQGRQS
jgi:hypothetical protein